MNPRKVCAVLNAYNYYNCNHWKHRKVDVGVNEYYLDKLTGSPYIIDWLTAEGVAEKLLKDKLVDEPNCFCCDKFAKQINLGHDFHRGVNDQYLLCGFISIFYCPFCGEQLNVE